MRVRFVCLANSNKEGGRCVAGIELDAKNNPVFTDGNRPKWIRPVTNSLHGEVPVKQVSTLKLLDIAEVDVTELKPVAYQSENVYFYKYSIRKVGVFDRSGLQSLCEEKDRIFVNRGKAVSAEEITKLDHSLMLVHATRFEITQKVYENSPKPPQVRMLFEHGSHQYDFPVTDPDCIERYRKTPEELKTIRQTYLTLSLGISWEGWHYKLVAAVI